MNTTQICGAVAVILLIIIVGIWSGRKVTGASDFVSGGSSSGGGTVAGMIMGTLVGGACTIGTAQLAFSYGISAWWYTLGCGIACLTIGVVYSKPFRRSKYDTMAEILLDAYGRKINIISSALSVLSLILVMVSQLVSASTVVPYIFNRLSSIGCLLLTAALMLIYVIFGGTLGAGEMGKIKIALLYATIIAGAILIFRSGSIPTFRTELDPETHFDFLLFGAGEEVGKLLSVIMGTVSVQSYMQAVRMARSDSAARNGALISAVLIPLIGAGSVLIGLFMRVQNPGLENSKNAFSLFILQYMPDWLSGIFIGTMLLVIIGSGASVILTAASILIRGVVRPLCPRFEDEKACLILIRVSMVILLAISCTLGTGILGDVVLNFTFLSTRIIASTLFAPVVCALFLPGKIHRRWACIAATAGPITVFLFTVWNILPFDSMFAGIAVSVLCCMIGIPAQRNAAADAAKEI